MTKIPLVYATDENYAPYCATSIASVLKNSKINTEFIFYILAEEMSEETKKKFQALKKIKDCSIYFITIDKEQFRRCPISHHFSIETYFKFSIASLLQDVDKVLYLDCDVIILEDLSEFFSTDIEDFYVGMVSDAIIGSASGADQKRLGLAENSEYFNAGLIIMNLKKWREEDIEKKLLKWTEENSEKIMWVDQDVMNVVFKGFIKKLPEEYNVQLNYYDSREKLGDVKGKLKVVHYCGKGKPWNNKDMFLADYFWKYAKICPFYDLIREKCLLHYSEMQKSEVDFIKQLISENQPKKILEVGVAAGSCLAIMLNEVRQNDDAMVYGIDYSEKYYRDKKMKSGWIVDDLYHEMAQKFKIFTGGVAACFLEEIGNDIDFCVLDTMHILPGELLDFLMAMPFLKENSICILHDTNMQNLPLENGTIRVSKEANTKNLQFVGDAYATGVLASMLASEKIFPAEYLREFALPNIMAFRITADLKKYIQNVFHALALPWKYKLSEGDEKIVGASIEKNYGKNNADYFYKISGMMRKRIEMEEKRHQEMKKNDLQREVFDFQPVLARVAHEKSHSSCEKIINKIKFAVFEPKRFFNKYLEKMSTRFLHKQHLPKVLAIVNHFYGQSKDWEGKSTSQDREVRKEIVQKALNALKKIPNIDIKICGINNSSLVDIDKDFSYLTDPTLLIYETIEWMSTQTGKYDYFINIEDDILLPRETFENILEFDRENRIDECFHPNRMEYRGGEEYCVDTKAWPGWKDQSKNYKGCELKVGENPHSGIAILSKEKLLYAKENSDLGRRDKIIAHHMESAFANLLAPFQLFRAYSNPTLHKVIHLDNWDPEINKHNS
jgi:lipopolysaccharide biosynthesis glycosyltransferase